MGDFLPGLEEALHHVRTVQRGPRARGECALCVVIDYAKPGVREALEVASAGTISGRALQRALRASGVSVDRSVISKHRNEDHQP